MTFEKINPKSNSDHDQVELLRLFYHRGEEPGGFTQTEAKRLLGQWVKPRHKIFGDSGFVVGRYYQDSSLPDCCRWTVEIEWVDKQGFSTGTRTGYIKQDFIKSFRVLTLSEKRSLERNWHTYRRSKGMSM